MNESPRCQRCGAALTGQAVDGLCANCLLELALKPPLIPSEREEAESSAPIDRGKTVLVAPLTEVPPTEVPGTVIGHYNLLQKIGEGGMGAVYLAEQQEPVRRQVALKIIKLGMDTRTVIARFEAERQALALMDHPNIARVFDAGATDTGRPYFVMELVRGVAITKYCDEHKLRLPERLDLFITICHAIEHAHQKGIIHRDIKPSNVLVSVHDHKPVLKVIDFGIAKATGQRLTDKTVFTELQCFLGTPAYCSPEQAEMSGLDIDTRSDIYSLGVLLFELLTGKLPFDMERLLRAGLDEMRRVICQVEPPRPSTRVGTLTQEERTTVAERRDLEAGQLEKRVAGDLDWIVMKALEKDRARRYDTANSFAQDVQRHLDNEPVVACPPSNLYRLRKFVRRNRLAVTAASAVTAALIIGLGVSTWSLFKEKTARTRAEQAEGEQTRERKLAEQAGHAATLARDQTARLFSLSQVQRGVELLENHDHSGLLYLLEARKAVEHLPEERTARTLLWNGWLQSLPKSEGKVLQTTNRLQSIAFGGDPEWLATGTAEGQVLLWNANTMAPLARLKTGAESVHSVEFSASGRLLVVKTGSPFQLWNLAPLVSNRAPQALVTRVARIGWDPGRHRVVTLHHEGQPVPGEPTAEYSSDRSDIQIWEAKSGQVRRSKWSDKSLVNHNLALSPDGSKLAAGYHSLVLLDAANAKRLQPMLRTNSSARSREMSRKLFFSSDGRWLWECVASRGQRYEVATGQPVGEPIPGDYPFVSRDGQRFAMQRDRALQLYDTETGESIGPSIRHETNNSIDAAVFSPDGKLLATAGPDRSFRLWDTRTGQSVGKPVVQPQAMTALAFSGDGQWLAVITQDGKVRLHRLVDETPIPLREWTDTQILGRNPQGHLLAHAISNRVIQWRDPMTGLAVSKAWNIPASESLVSAAFSLDGQTLAVASEDAKREGRIRFWNIATSDGLEPFFTSSNGVALAFSADGQTLAGLNRRDGSIHFWNVARREAGAHLSWPDQPDFSWMDLQFSPDGKYVAARSGMKSVHVWDVIAGKPVGKPVKHRMGGTVADSYMALSPDWKLALAAGGLLNFSDPQRPVPVDKPIPAQATQSAVAAEFSPDGRFLALAARDKTVRVWDVSTGRPWGQVMKTPDGAAALAFSPDGRLLVTAGVTMNSPTDFSGNIRLWETATGQPCSSPLRFSGMVTGLWMDRDLRFVTVSASQMADRKIPPTVQMWGLPSGDTSLAEMQQQTWLKAGSRLDEFGNIEVIPGGR